MYWYMAGVAVCAIAARNLKRKVSGQKKLYQAALILMMGFLLAAVFYQVDKDKAGEDQIARGEPGQGSQEREYVVEADGVLEEYPLKFQIEEKKLTKEQRQEYFKKAKKELDKVILGENPSKEEVSSALYLPETLQEGAVEAEYQFSDYEVFEPDGTLKTEVREPVTVEITAELSCQNDSCLYTFLVQAVPREKSEQDLFAEKLSTLLRQENDREDTDYVKLPGEVDGKTVIWKEQTENRSMIAVLLGIAGAVGIILSEKEEQKRRETKRQDQMLLDYPEIVSKLSLLLGAGMNISAAWEKIALSYQKKRENGEIESRYAYEEMLTVLREIRDGVGELQAYENFGERCHLAVYRKLSSLIVQNVRKGAKGMQQLLEEEETEAFEQRKARAKKAGEEAGTKLLLPMGIMLVIVLVILVVPAGLSLGV